MNELELQRTVTHVALDASASSGFALAGSGAIREHGVINRMSEDVDLFTSNTNEGTFGSAVDRVVDALNAAGYAVDHYTDAQLIEAAAERDPGFDAGMFANQLQRVSRLTEDDLKEYGVDATELAAITERLTGWAAQLLSAHH